MIKYWFCLLTLVTVVAVLAKTTVTAEEKELPDKYYNSDPTPTKISNPSAEFEMIDTVLFLLNIGCSAVDRFKLVKVNEVWSLVGESN